MCSPTLAFAGASAALSIVSEVSNYMGQKQQADATYDAAVADRNAKTSQTYARLSEEKQAAGLEIEKNTMRARKARSTAAVAAGEAGVSGTSVDALQANFSMQEDRFNTSVRKNYEFKKRQGDAQVRGFTAVAQSRANSVQQPSFLGAAARAVGGAISAYDRFEVGNELFPADETA